jgi:hypothetical protein
MTGDAIRRVKAITGADVWRYIARIEASHPH